MDTYEKELREQMATHKPEDMVKVRALRHCSGETPPGPDRKTVTLAEDKTGEVMWFVARRWLAKKWAALVPAPAARKANRPIEKKKTAAPAA